MQSTVPVSFSRAHRVASASSADAGADADAGSTAGRGGGGESAATGGGTNTVAAARGAFGSVAGVPQPGWDSATTRNRKRSRSTCIGAQSHPGPAVRPGGNAGGTRRAQSPRMRLFSLVSAPFALLGAAGLLSLAPACGASSGGATPHGGADGGIEATTGDGGSHAPGADGASDSASGPGPADSHGGSPTDSSGGAPDTSVGPGTSSASTLAGKLGKPSRLLVGLGGTAASAIKSQGITPDLYEDYLVGVGAGDWTTWNSPSGAYVGVVASAADSVGAVPMFTLYQMAQNGDGNISDITDPAFMTPYWANVVLLFKQLAAYGKPTLVNFEPDFWGYTEQASPGGDPTKLAAKVTVAPDCASLSDDVAGLAHCLVLIARKYAPKAYVGFSPSTWGANNLSDVVTYMKKVGGETPTSS